MLFNPPAAMDIQALKSKALAWANRFEVACYLDHNSYPGFFYHDYDCLIGVSNRLVTEGQRQSFETLRSTHDKNGGWLFGFMAYDLKNEIERLHSSHFDGIGLPEMYFFEPDHVIRTGKEKWEVFSKAGDPALLWDEILLMPVVPEHVLPVKPRAIQKRISKKVYLDTVETIRNHIIEGDIYEMNFCQEFYRDDFQTDPAALFQRLNHIAKAPFSAYFKYRDKYLLCASPERFLKKSGRQLISQPIKGTIRRGADEREDAQLRQALLHSAKDRAEHVMIVDLVRNDLARSCQPGSVAVKELFGIYPFQQLLQMISTITGTLREDTHWVDAIRFAFPMGSMTGAPKIKAMELIEDYEHTKRGLYSGAVGYITPEGDFDFNVVIRSMLYNAENRYLSFQAGGAIVYDSVGAEEYDECLLKLKPILKALGADIYSYK